MSLQISASLYEKGYVIHTTCILMIHGTQNTFAKYQNFWVSSCVIF